ncbi:MAG TPA: DUF2059 domain-containing protein [Caulobacteraceae bacterium]|nr:DUF2059 domain-containing protein [Caulobacteraceae bacterium]
MRATVLAVLCVAPSAFAQAPAPAPAAPPPSPATLALARKVAEHDDFLGLVRTVGGAQVAGVEASLGPLTPAEKVKVEAIAKSKLDEGLGRVVDKIAVIYAATMSSQDLQATASFLATPAGQAYSNRLFKVLPGLGESLKGFDFKREVLAQTCAQIGKGCPPKQAPAPPAAAAPLPAPGPSPRPRG